MQSKEELKAVLAAARQSDGLVWLRGYRNSAGQVADYLIKLQPANYYGILLGDADVYMEELSKKTDEELTAAVGLPLSFAAILRTVMKDIQIGLANRKEAQQTNTVQESTFLPWNGDPNLMVKSSDAAGDVSLRNIEVLQTNILEAAPVKTSSRVRTPTTPTDSVVAQRAIQAVWPLSKFSSQYTLANTKFERLEVAAPQAP